MPKTRHHLPACALLLVACAFATPASAAGNLTIRSIESWPSAPTWQDEVEIRITGSSSCLVASEARGIPQEKVITVDLALLCNIHPVVQRNFTVNAKVGRLQPDTYRVDILAEDSVVAAAEATVFDLATLFLEAAGPYTDEEPVIFQVGLYSACANFEVVPRIDQSLIDIFVDRSCALLPPSPSLIHRTLEAGLLPVGTYEVRLFDITNQAGFFAVRRDEIEVHDAAGCIPGDTVLCLQDDRFRVQVQWRDFKDRRGDGQAVPLPDRDDTGAFWFFNENNLELTVKVLDACRVNGRHWVFISSGSTVGYQITIEDTKADRSIVWGNALGNTPSLIPDTEGFDTCP